MVDRLALVGVGNVKLDYRPFEHLKRIEQCQRGAGEGGRNDDDPCALVNRLMYQKDQLFIPVALVKPAGRAAAARAAEVFAPCQGRGAEDGGPALAQAVEIGTAEHLDWFHGKSLYSQRCG